MKKVIPLLIILAAASLIVFSQGNDLPEGLFAMAQTERAFAKLSVEKGVREAFTTYFADDGVNFQPHPVITKEAFAKQPAPAGPPQIALNWAPTYGGVARSADLGFSTGPYVVEDRSGKNRPPAHGMFFSLWKKQSAGDWRVVVDMGVRLENAFSPLDAGFRSAPEWKSKASGETVDLEAERGALLKTDQAFFDLAKSGKASNAWRKFLSEDARVYRQLTSPVVDKTALQNWIARQDGALAGKPIKSDVSNAADLGYCYGSFELKRGEGAIEKGYYTRVWRRDEKGDWRIVFDVNNPLPADEK
jgi:ketosteroid isomerase-like protein